MSAWGGVATEAPDKVLAAQWNGAQRKGDRDITYQRKERTWFVVSGTDSRGIEFYEKFTMRGQQVAFLNITFPRSRLRQFERWVEVIENGFRPVPLPDGPPEIASQLSRSRAEGPSDRRPAEREPSAGSEKIAPSPQRQKESTVGRTSEKQPRADVAVAAKQLPLGEKIAGKPGFVYSPFTPDVRLVDVTDIPSGTKVKCPYTMKIFIVP